MRFYIEYEKANGEQTIFEKAEIVGTYDKQCRERGFKVFEEGRGYRNVNYNRIISIKASNHLN